MQLNAMIEHAKTHGGGTYRVLSGYNFPVNFLSAEHEFGYYVSESHGIENLPELYSVVIEEFVSNRIVLGSGGYLGLWQDDKGNWSIDVSHWHDSLDAALWYGKQNSQRAIYSLETNGAVTIGL